MTPHASTKGGDTGSISDLVERSIETFGERSWLRFGEQTYSFDDLGVEVQRRATFLDRVGVRRGDVVQLCLGNSPEHIFTWLAVLQVGATSLAVNPESSDDEVAAFAEQSSAVLVITTADRCRALIDVLPSATTVVDVADAAVEMAGDRIEPRAQPGDVATLIATSGTTARPKLVMQSHRTYVLTAESFPSWIGLRADDVLMAQMPLFHLNAQVYSVLGSLVAGTRLALFERFSASRFWDRVEQYGCTQANLMGAMLEILMLQPPSSRERDSSLRLCYSAPAPPEDRHREIEQRFGLRFTSGYGLSESPFGMIWPRDASPYGALGYPRQHAFRLDVHNEAKVVDDAGEEVALGDTGELSLRSPAVMEGYFRDPTATAQVLVDGWLRTGDLVRQDDDGCYYFVSRKKDVIRRRGENIAAAEVESVVRSHPDVADAAVVAVPSELSEDEVKAFVVLVDGVATTAAGIHAWCLERLTRFKVPRYVEFVESIPSTPTGRHAKHQLPRERTDAEHDFIDTPD